MGGKKPRCIHRGDAIFEVGDRKITIGGASDYGAYLRRAPDVLVSCASGKFDVSPANELPFGVGRWSKLNAIARPRTFDVLHLDWSDGDDPPFDAEFLHDLLEQVPTGGHVVFCCVGGHGRTGTALAALRILGTNCSANEAISYIRKAYCFDAVETTRQIQWLCDLAGQNEAPIDKSGKRVEVFLDRSHDRNSNGRMRL